MTADQLRAVALRQVPLERQAQGLPRYVADQGALRRLAAALVRSDRGARRAA